MNDILSGTYKGNTYRIKVECYPNTPAIKVQLLPVNAGERITMTQNLGQPLPVIRHFSVTGCWRWTAPPSWTIWRKMIWATSWTTSVTMPMYLPE